MADINVVHLSHSTRSVRSPNDDIFKMTDTKNSQEMKGNESAINLYLPLAAREATAKQTLDRFTLKSDDWLSAKNFSVYIDRETTILSLAYSMHRQGAYS